ncbi:Uncharacterized protein Rs2_04634 [Raphanus sativus]|nr:Uncharacterized protein Rs2_04634 [Raphanus sativus]
MESNPIKPIEVKTVSVEVELEVNKGLELAENDGIRIERAKDMMDLEGKSLDDEVMGFDEAEFLLEGHDDTMDNDEEFQSLTDPELEEMVTVDENKEDTMKEIDQEPVGEDEEKKKGTRKALFKPASLAVGASKKLLVQAVFSPRKKTQGKAGKKQGDATRKKEDKGPSIPKPPSAKP